MSNVIVGSACSPSSVPVVAPVEKLNMANIAAIKTALEQFFIQAGLSSENTARTKKITLSSSTGNVGLIKGFSEVSFRVQISNTNFKDLNVECIKSDSGKHSIQNHLRDEAIAVVQRKLSELNKSQFAVVAEGEEYCEGREFNFNLKVSSKS